ncbi:MAG: FHA domain-containing protein [Chloroflexales bacterium]|nr:FHA domain-containing protein [Chloroflexales bacterium]
MTRTKPGLLTYNRADGTTEHFQLLQDVTTLGRSASCTIVIVAPTVSRMHAMIQTQHDRYLLVDAESANGTFVNGKRINHTHRLNTDDEIWLGSSEVKLHFSDPEETVVATAEHADASLLIDEQAHTVRVYGNPVALSPLEYGVLLHLARHPGTVCTRDSCFQTVWGYAYDPVTCDDALNACVAKLRRNLRNAAQAAGKETPPITTILRVGFRLDATVAFTGRE